MAKTKKNWSFFNKCWGHCYWNILQIWYFISIFTLGWFIPPTFYNMGVWQHRKLPLARLNSCIGIAADEWLHIPIMSYAKTEDIFRYIQNSNFYRYTCIWTSTWLWLFWYIDRYFQKATELVKWCTGCPKKTQHLIK